MDPANIQNLSTESTTPTPPVPNPTSSVQPPTPTPPQSPQKIKWGKGALIGTGVLSVILLVVGISTGIFLVKQKQLAAIKAGPNICTWETCGDDPNKWAAGAAVADGKIQEGGGADLVKDIIDKAIKTGDNSSVGNTIQHIDAVLNANLNDSEKQALGGILNDTQKQALSGSLSPTTSSQGNTGPTLTDGAGGVLLNRTGACGQCGGLNQGGCDNNPTSLGGIAGGRCGFGCEGGLHFCNGSGSCQGSCPDGQESAGPASSNPAAYACLTTGVGCGVGGAVGIGKQDIQINAPSTSLSSSTGAPPPDYSNFEYITFTCSRCGTDQRCQTEIGTNPQFSFGANFGGCSQVDRRQKGTADNYDAVSLCSSGCSGGGSTVQVTTQQNGGGGPTLTPVSAPQCNQACGSGCPSNLTCVSGVCRNPACTGETNCVCPGSSFQCQQLKIFRAGAEITAAQIQKGDTIVFRGFASATNTTISKLQFTLTKNSVAQTPADVTATLTNGQYQADYSVNIDTATSYSVTVVPISP